MEIFTSTETEEHKTVKKSIFPIQMKYRLQSIY